MKNPTDSTIPAPMNATSVNRWIGGNQRQIEMYKEMASIAEQYNDQQELERLARRIAELNEDNDDLRSILEAK
jgi:hypothetical protein